MKCAVCGGKVTPDDAGLTKKLINRAREDYLCRECLKKEFKLTDAQLDRLVENFKKAGCTLFK